MGKYWRHFFYSNCFVFLSQTIYLDVYVFPYSSVGIYGNADPLDVSQWIQLERSTPNDNAYTGSMVWNSDASSCTGFPNGLNIKFLVAYSGEKVNAQNKIIAASYEYTSIPWKFRYCSFICVYEHLCTGFEA